MKMCWFQTVPGMFSEHDILRKTAEFEIFCVFYWILSGNVVISNCSRNVLGTVFLYHFSHWILTENTETTSSTSSTANGADDSDKEQNLDVNGPDGILEAFSSEALLQQISPQHLPVCYGGEVDDNVVFTFVDPIYRNLVGVSAEPDPYSGYEVYAEADREEKRSWKQTVSFKLLSVGISFSHCILTENVVISNCS